MSNDARLMFARTRRCVHDGSAARLHLLNDSMPVLAPGPMSRRLLTGLLVGLLALSCTWAAPEPHPAGTAEPATYLADFGRLARVQWPRNRTLTIVCFGHSVPAGYFKTPEVRSLEAYPHLLRLKLANKYPHAVINVIVSAVGGENAQTGAARFERDVLPLRPDVLLLDYALNDRALGLETARAAWSAIVEKAQARGIRVLLLTPTADTKDRLDDPASPLNRHAQQIRELARQHGVGLVDSLARFQAHVAKGGTVADLMSQSNHPNRRGHEFVAEAIGAWFP